MKDFGAAWTYLTHNSGAWLKTGNCMCVSRDGAHVECDAADDSDEIVSLNFSEFGQRFAKSRFVKVEQ